MLDHLPKEDGKGIVRTIADAYIDEAINKVVTIDEARGLEKRANTKVVEIAKRMLQEKTDIKFIASVTGLSNDEILTLKNKM